MNVQDAIENVALKRKARARAFDEHAKAGNELTKANNEVTAAEAQLKTVTDRAIENAS